MTQEILPDTTINRAEHVLDTMVDEKTVLLSIHSGNYIELNRTSTAIWLLIDGENDISTIVERLIDTYDVDLIQCKDQVCEFVDKLLREELVNFN